MVANLLLQPHPCDWTFAGYARNIGAISLGIFFILAVMQPFEINLLPTSEALKIGFAFGMLMMWTTSSGTFAALLLTTHPWLWKY